MGSGIGFASPRSPVTAVVYERYGPPDVLRLKDVPTPEPKAHEVRVRIRATTASSGDWRARSLDLPPGFGVIGRLVFGIVRPRQPILGTEFSGDVESAGTDVTNFKAGDAVFGFSGSRMGCYAEYVCMPAHGRIAPKPPNLSYEEAAALCFGGSTALSFFRRGKVQRGERVLINGASGAVGVAAVQLAKHLGAHVTGVCSGANTALVRSLGADNVLDYTQTDFTTAGETYDAIMDTAGTAPFSRIKHSLRDGGRLLKVLGGFTDLLTAPWISLTGRKKVIVGPAAESAEHVRLLGELAEAGAYKAVIDRRYPIEEIVDAHRYLDTGRKRGSIVVTVA